MGWTDLSICLEGPVVEDIRAHFVQRWNFEYDLKYGAGRDGKYHRLALNSPSDTYHDNGKNVQASVDSEKPGSSDGKDDEQKPGMATAPGAGADREEEPHDGHHFHPRPDGFIDTLEGRTRQSMTEFMSRNGDNEVRDDSGVSVQLVRSVGRWSHGTPTEVRFALTLYYLQAIAE